MTQFERELEPQLQREAWEQAWRTYVGAFEQVRSRCREFLESQAEWEQAPEPARMCVAELAAGLALSFLVGYAASAAWALTGGRWFGRGGAADAPPPPDEEVRLFVEEQMGRSLLPVLQELARLHGDIGRLREQVDRLEKGKP